MSEGHAAVRALQISMTRAVTRGHGDVGALVATEGHIEYLISLAPVITESCEMPVVWSDT